MATATGLDVEAGGDSRLNGDLGSVSLNDILQMMGMAKRTGTIRVTFQGREGKIYLKDGEVLHAASGSVIGEDALARLMRWTDAKFAIEEGIDDAPATIAKSADAAMLDLLRRMDEGEDQGDLFTPFPPLDRPDLSDLARKVRQAKLRPQQRYARRRALLIGSLVTVVLGLSALGAYAYRFLESTTDPTTFPSLSAASAPTARGEAPVLQAAMAVGSLDAPSLAAAYGVDWASSAGDPTPAVEEPVAAAEPAVVTGTAELLILVEPWALVSIDGQEVGETPMPAVSVSAGAHEISLTNPARAGALTDTIVVEPGESRTLRYSMDDTGKVKVVVTPWADVFIAGRHIGQTPMGTLELPLGSHTIVFRHPELGEKTETVEVRAGETLTLKVDM